MKKVIRACEHAGLRYEPNHRHPRLTDPSTGRFVTISATPSCPFAHTHVLRDVRKYLHIKVTL